MRWRGVWKRAGFIPTTKVIAIPIMLLAIAVLVVPLAGEGQPVANPPPA